MSEVQDLVAERDWAAVRQLYTNCGWRDAGAAPHSSLRVMIARDAPGGAVIGAVVYRVEQPPLAAEWHDRYGAVSRVALVEILVAPGCRRRGTGTRLVRAVAAVAVAAQIPFVWAWPSLAGTPSQRSARIHFFQTCGMAMDADMHPGHVNLVGQSAAMVDKTGSHD